MMMYRRWNRLLAATMVGISSAALAAAPAAPGGQSDKPIEVSSDKLDVFQDQNKAVFTGNVIAIQGTSNLRANVMTVFYRQDGDKNKKAPADQTADAVKAAAAKTATATPAADAPPPGIYRIEATGDVVFTTPTEAATGDTGIYDVDADTIDVLGKTVVLTQGANVLRGNKLNYNMGTGRSILTAGGSTSDVTGTTGSKPARVHGLFMPKSDNKTPPKPATPPKPPVAP